MSLTGLKRHGISKETYKNFLIDAGAVYAFDDETDIENLTDEDILGATRDGNSFTIEQEFREMEVDGAKGPVKGSRRIINVMVQLTANIIQMSTDNFLKALPGASAEDHPDTDATHDKISRKIGDALEYVGRLALVGTIHQTDEPIICVLKNGLHDDNFSIETSEDDEATLELNFTGHFDPENLDEEPWEIHYPKEDNGEE
ncbi:hypothetical protein MWH25_01425 [Natroniella acetigena]|uniref:hypothetical protein n=1 Tax=Natroniella acetigena TaxID=52004 RepID=UPI00200B6896|nr:hypothetical protein [Natroniella acetigena]MCK8826408.1 hypothetical protein [Natroniella acetigena]